MDGNDRIWFDQFEKRFIEQIDSVKKQLSMRHGYFIEAYERSCDDIKVNEEDIKIIKKETTFSRLIQRNPVKSFIVFAVVIIVITSIFNLQDVMDAAKGFLGKY